MGDYSHIPATPGIYLITCIRGRDAWYYVGQSSNMQERLYKHERYLMWEHPNKNRQAFKMLQSLWDSGAEFRYSVIEELPSTKDILQYEAYYIQEYKRKYGRRVLNQTGKIKVPPKVLRQRSEVVETKHKTVSRLWTVLMVLSPLPAAVLVVKTGVSFFGLSPVWMFLGTYVAGLLAALASMGMIMTVHKNTKESNDGQ